MMPRKAFQVRLDRQLHEQLDFFSDATGTSMNRLVVDALEIYLRNLAVQLDTGLTDTLRQVRAYAGSEENEERDFEAFVKGEMSLPDPAEGTIVDEATTPDRTSDHLGRILAGLG